MGRLLFSISLSLKGDVIRRLEDGMDKETDIGKNFDEEGEIVDFMCTFRYTFRYTYIKINRDGNIKC